MALSDFTISQPRPLPVFILADTSGSMSVDGKIQSLVIALNDMLVSLQSERFRSIDLQLALITFGQSVTVNQPVSVSKISSPFQLEAAGPTPMGEAFSMLLSMLEDHEVVSSRAYRPFIILVSDGVPTDEWEEALQKLKQSARASKATRLAMAIGGDADKEMLRLFPNHLEAPLFEAHNAKDIARFFRFVTLSIQATGRSITPNAPTLAQLPSVDDLDELF